jgi:AraC-like DNA-binding protein
VTVSGPKVRDLRTASQERDLEGTAVSLLAAFDHVPNTYVFVKDVDRVFVACNAPFVELMGCSTKEDIFGRRDEDFSPDHLVERYRNDDQVVLTTGVTLVDIVELVGKRDDTYEWFTTSKSPIRRNDGTITGIISVTRRISGRDSAVERFLSLTPAVEYMCREYMHRITVKELAAQVQMSMSHFNRLFRHHFNMSPYKYLMRVRITAACDLLATTELSVSAISARTGFYDSSHLANEFHADQGTSPREYRIRVQNRRGPSTYFQIDSHAGATQRIDELQGVSDVGNAEEPEGLPQAKDGHTKTWP